MFNGFRQPPLTSQRQAQIIMGAGVVGIELQHPLILFDRFNRPSRMLPRGDRPWWGN